MVHQKHHLQDHPIPKGLQIFESRLSIAGIERRKRAAAAFIRGTAQELVLEREPSNRDDPNAIRVIGCSRAWFRQQRHFLGYVPREIAKRIVERGYWQSIQPRLAMTYLARGFVEIEFQILGPAGEKYRYNPPQYSKEEPTYSYVDWIKRLKSEKRYEEAIELLSNLIDQEEAQAREKGKGWGVAPWYYEQLAIIYRREKRYALEVATLGRYAAQPHAPGVGPQKLADRLRRAKELANKS